MTESLASSMSSSSSMSKSSGMSSSKLCQVVFHDIEEVYATDSDIKARYTVLPELKARSGDRIGLYKVGWTSASEYHTCIFAPRPEKADGRVSITLPVESLPKTEGDMYQLCYVTCDGEVVAASIPFMFRVPSASELIAVDDPQDPGLVVFKSRSSLMQEELAYHRSQHESYMADIDKLKSDLSKLNQELINKSSALDKKCEEVKQLEMIASDKQQEIRELKQDLSFLETAMTLMKKNQDAAEKEQKKLKDRNESEAEIYEATIAKLRSELDEITKERDSLKSEIQNLEEVIRIHGEDTADINALRDKIDELSSNHNAVLAEKDALLEKEKAELDKITKERDYLVLEKQNLDEVIRIREGEQTDVEALEKKIENLSAKHNTEVAEKISLSAEVKELYYEMELLKKELSFANKNAEMYKKQVDEIPKTPEDLRAALIKIDDEKALLQVAVMSIEEEMNLLKQRNESLQKELECFKSSTSINDKQDQGASSSQSHSPHELLAMRDEQIAELKSRVAVLEIELSNNLKKQEEMKSQMDRVKKNCDNLMNMTSKQYEELEDLKREKASLLSKIGCANHSSSVPMETQDRLMISGLQKLLDASLREKLKLESQVIELKKELIGKVSVSDLPQH